MRIYEEINHNTQILVNENFQIFICQRDIANNTSAVELYTEDLEKIQNIINKIKR